MLTSSLIYLTAFEALQSVVCVARRHSVGRLSGNSLVSIACWCSLLPSTVTRDRPMSACFGASGSLGGSFQSFDDLSKSKCGSDLCAQGFTSLPWAATIACPGRRLSNLGSSASSPSCYSFLRAAWTRLETLKLSQRV